MLVVAATAPSALGATLQDDLRWTPSTSTDVAGYVVHVGGTPGFFDSGGGAAIDIGQSYALANNVASRPLGDFLTGSAYVVMQAYDDEGLYSVASNELFVEIEAPLPPGCTTDADCSDGNLCTGVEQCVAGQCVAGSPPSCSATTACHTAGCDPGLGCVELPTSGGACNDGNACTTGDTCAAGSCQGGAALSCPTPGPCQAGWCDVASGCVSAPVADGTSCSDGNPNTEGDACQAGTCIGQAPPPAPAPPPPSPPPGENGLLFYDGFEFQTVGAPATNWLVSGFDGQTVASDKFTVVTAPGGGLALANDRNPWRRYYSHWDVAGADAWESYELVGRLRIEDVSGGIGATLVSSFPVTTDNIALVRDASTPSFHVEVMLNGTAAACTGTVDTGVVPSAGEWMVFRLRAIPDANGVHVQAKIWPNAGSEPSGWQADCIAPTAVSFGRPGTIAAGPGRKLYDDFGAWLVDASDPGTDPNAPLFEDAFGEHVAGEDPDGWTQSDHRGRDIGKTLAMVGLTPESDPALWTDLSATDLFMHADVPGSRSWRDYEVTGRMMAGFLRTGIGITAYSRLLDAGSAISLTRRNYGSFMVAVEEAWPHQCQGTTDTGVVSAPYEWQAFRLQTVSEAGGVRVRAKVWTDGTPEPATWQADCLVAPGVVSGGGTVGVWSTGTGDKFWDDLSVTPVGAP